MAMGLGSLMRILVSFLVVCVVLKVERSEAANYTVGDATGWTVPSYDDFYDDWENNKIFRVGDQLIFNWTGIQNVVQVTEAQYDNCVNVTSGVITTSPAIFNLTNIGDHYFICTIANQCLRGQKLSIEVQRALATPPPPPPSPSPPPPSPSSSPPPPSPSPSPSPTPSSSATPPPPSTTASNPAPSPESTTNTTSPPSTGTPTAPSPSSSPSFGPVVALSAALPALVFFL